MFSVSRSIRFFRCNICYIYPVLLLWSFGCEIDGGLNQNQHTPGNEDDGTALGMGDIAVDPTGSLFISSSNDKMIVGHIDTAEIEKVSAVGKPYRVAFGREGQVFVTSSDDYGILVAYNVHTKQVSWSLDINLLNISFNDWFVNFPLLNITEAGDKIVVTDPQSLRVFSTADGSKLHELTFSQDIIDVDLHPDGDRIIITLDHTWVGSLPNTQIYIYSMSTKQKTRIAVPNCSDELVLAKNGEVGFLAPTRCVEQNGDEKDPVSVVDINSSTFVRNLPGFGPTAVMLEGQMAVAFMDLDNLDESLFDSPEDIPQNSASRYHLMFIDVATLKFDTIEIGDNLPRYAMTPDGQMLLIDASTWFQDARIRLLDIPTRTLQMVAGPDVRLNNYVITSDSTNVFLLDDGLFNLSVADLVIDTVPLLFTPQNLNITPDDSRLLLRESDTVLWVYDIANQSTTHSMVLSDSIM